ncbi:MAG: ABC transporter substrate-binding protein [Thermodesulfobacteriota bacterium]
MAMKKIVIAVTALLILASVSAIWAATPGVTDKEVVIGVTTPVSGPAALWGVTAQGMKAWADHVNAQGGVNGRQIRLVVKDDAYNPTRAMANLQEMKGSVFAVCGLLGTAILNTAKDFFPENNMPLITPYGDVRIWAKQPKDKRKLVFVAYPDYEDEAEYITKYAAYKLGAKKIAMFYQNDDYGKTALLGVEKAVKEMNDKAKLVAAVPYEVTERALGSHALKLKESGADALIIYTTPTHGALIVKEIAKIDYKPTRLATFTLGDPIMYKVAGEIWEGTYVAIAGNAGIPGADPPADKAVEILLKYDPKLKDKEYLALFGAVSMMHLVEGLKNAGKNLTSDSFVKGMERIKEWKPEGIGAPVTYTSDQHHGLNASRMGKAKDGKHIPIEDYSIFKPRF